jgi:hypothetical protein
LAGRGIAPASWLPPAYPARLSSFPIAQPQQLPLYRLPLSNDRIAHRQRLFVALVLSRELIDDRPQIGCSVHTRQQPSVLLLLGGGAARFVFFSSCCEKFSHPASVSTTNTTINPIINPRRAVVFIEYTDRVRCAQIHEAL